MKVLGTVLMNSRDALVVDMLHPMSYERVQTKGSDLLIGSDGHGCYDVLYHMPYGSGPKAFGGAKIKWQLKDGSILESDGWWWQGRSEAAAEHLGIRFANVSIESIGELCDCFVFTGRLIDTRRLADYTKDLEPWRCGLDYNTTRYAAYTVKQDLKAQGEDPRGQEPQELFDRIAMLVVQEV